MVRLVRSEPAPHDLVADPTDEPSMAIRWDPAGGTIGDGVAETDAVVNLCGRSIGTHRWTSSERQLLIESRIAPTRLLATALAGIDDGPRVLVNASAIGWYGDRGDEVITEESRPGAGFLAELCADWELATGPAEDAGIRVVRARTGLVLSPSGGFLARPLQLFRLGLGGRLGSGDQYWSWISLDDEVSAILYCLDHDDVDGPANLTAPQPVTNRDFTRVLAELLHRPAALPVPRAAGRVLLGRDLADEVVFGGQRVLPATLESHGFSFGHRRVEDALAAVLG